MTTELEAAVRRLEAVAEGGIVDTGGDDSITLAGDVATVLAALSSPPTDDAREALGSVVNAEVVQAALDAVISTLNDIKQYPTVRISIAAYRLKRLQRQIDQQAFEVRPRGPVTDAEVEAAAKAMFEDPIQPGDGYTWAQMVTEDSSRADIWRADARRVLEAARNAQLVSAENTRPTNHADGGL